MSVPNVGITGVIQQAPPQGTLGGGLSDLAKFLMLVRQQQTQEAQQRATAQYQQQQISLAQQQEAAKQAAAQAAQAHEAALQAAGSKAIPLLTQPDFQRVQVAPSTDPNAGAMMPVNFAAPANQIGQFAASAGPYAAELLKDPGIQELTKAITNRMAERAKSQKVSPDETLLPGYGEPGYGPGGGAFTAAPAEKPSTEYYDAKKLAGFGAIPDRQLTGEQNARILALMKDVKASGASRNTVNIPGSNAAGDKLFGGIWDQVTTEGDQMSALAKDNRRIEETLKFLNDPTTNVIMGPGATIEQIARQVAVRVTGNPDPSAEQTAALKVMLAQRSLTGLQRLKGLGRVLDREVQSLDRGLQTNLDESTKSSFMKGLEAAKEVNDEQIAFYRQKAALAPDIPGVPAAQMAAARRYLTSQTEPVNKPDDLGIKPGQAPALLPQSIMVKGAPAGRVAGTDTYSYMADQNTRVIVDKNGKEIRREKIR